MRKMINWLENVNNWLKFYKKKPKMSRRLFKYSNKIK